MENATRSELSFGMRGIPREDLIQIEELREIRKALTNDRN
jgi:hypothetical protein